MAAYLEGAHRRTETIKSKVSAGRDRGAREGPQRKLRERAPFTGLARARTFCRAPSSLCRPVVRTSGGRHDILTTFVARRAPRCGLAFRLRLERSRYILWCMNYNCCSKFYIFIYIYERIFFYIKSTRSVGPCRLPFSRRRGDERI